MDHHPKRTLDRFEQLASDSEFALAILGAEASDCFELVSLEPGFKRTAAHAALGFLGIVALVRGVPRCELAVPLDASTITALGHAVAARMRADIQLRHGYVGTETMD